MKLEQIDPWVGLLADPSVDIRAWAKPQNVFVKTLQYRRRERSLFDDIHFPPVGEYDLYATPLWIDRGIEELRLMVTLLAELMVIKEGIARPGAGTAHHHPAGQSLREGQDSRVPGKISAGSAFISATSRPTRWGVSKVAKKKIEVRDPELVAA